MANSLVANIKAVFSSIGHAQGNVAIRPKKIKVR